MFTIPKQPQSAASEASWPRAISCEHHQSLHSALTLCAIAPQTTVVLGSPSRETKASKSRADSPTDPIPDGEFGPGSRTRTGAKDRAPVLFAGDSSRHFRFHSKRLGT